MNITWFLWFLSTKFEISVICFKLFHELDKSVRLVIPDNFFYLWRAMDSQKLLKYWKESLGIFAWGQFKLIALASLNNFIRSVKLFLKYFWWLGLVEISNLFISNTHITTYNSIRIHLTHCVVFFAYILCSRASTERKDMYYFWQYFRAIPLAILLLLAHSFIIIGTILIISTMFYLDSRINFSNLINSIKNGFIYVFCFPAAILIIDLALWTLSTGIVCVLFIHSSGMLFDPGEIRHITTSEIALTFTSNLILTVFRFIQLSFLSILYLRFKHAHPDLFGAK